MSGDLKAAIRGVWLVVTAVTLAAVLAPFVLSEETITRVTPVCESKRKDGSACWMCGTTTGFISISRGEWSGAAQANRAAIPLFALFVANASAAALSLARRAR